MQKYTLVKDIDSRNKMENKEKAIHLFEFTKQLYKQKYSQIYVIEKEEWYEYINNKNNELINFNFEDDMIKPIKLAEEPPVPNELKKYGIKTPNETINSDLYKNNGILKAIFAKWKLEYNNWESKVKNQKKCLYFFNKLKEKYNFLENESERFELVVGNLFIKYYDKIEYPLLTKRILIDFDAKKSIIRLQQTNSNIEFNDGILQEFDIIDNVNNLKKLKEDIKENLNNIFDQNLVDYIRGLKNILSENCEIYLKPVLFIKKKNQGIIRSLENIIEDIKNRKDLPNPIQRLIEPNVISKDDDYEEKTLNQKLFEIGGESQEILLYKEANREQLEIIKQIEKNDAIVVQGPPGTGKTHTIANLIGYFLSQGKNILVTSYTKKALSVIKDKIPSNIQSLCVSLVDDNNDEMEKSINGISDYVSRHNKRKLIEEIKELEIIRNNTFKEIQDIRNKIYSIRQKEKQTITYLGTGYSLQEIAKFIGDNEKNVRHIIPGEIKEKDIPIPVTLEELEYVYSLSDGSEECSLPDINYVISPEKFEEIQNNIQNYEKVKNEFNNKLSEILKTKVNLKLPDLTKYKIESMVKLKKLVKMFDYNNQQKWEYNLIRDGFNLNGFGKHWIDLISDIKQIYEYTINNSKVLINNNFELLQKEINYTELIKSLDDKFNFFNLLNSSNKKWSKIIKINGKSPELPKDKEKIKIYLNYKMNLDKLNLLWTNNIANNGGPDFESLGVRPEETTYNYIALIEKYLYWYENVVLPLIKEYKIDFSFIRKNIPDNSVFCEILFEYIHSVISKYIDFVYSNKEMGKSKGLLSNYKSLSCNELFDSLVSFNIEKYKTDYENLKIKSEKYNNVKRKEIISKIREYAPDWAYQIEKNENKKQEILDNFEIAWKWKQFCKIYDEIEAENEQTLLDESNKKSIKLRKITSELVEKKSWLCLIKNAEQDYAKFSALNSWKTTIKKIGKGTGKKAASLKIEAQKLMVDCQKIVPVWIMPITTALENLKVGENKFDVVIIDEASQADISALSIMYFAKKIIIIGDDEQVSPDAVGAKVELSEKISNLHLKNIIPNSHLYDLKTSIYTIGSLYFRTLKLIEHFRCAPEIIGYSNMLSYNGEIKPLRDISDLKVKPATIAYRVNGKRKLTQKINEEEAYNIVALMMACSNQKEYENMTFGVISLLGDEQTTLIQKLADQYMGYEECSKRKLLCGNPSYFQGDERDIIFISLVDSNASEGPVRKTTEGTENSTKKRYNVAVSRAKNQVWVVHSFDSKNDLKEGDLRKSLIEYMDNPINSLVKQNEIKIKSDSPFEEEVATNLYTNGYNIVQQYEVGAYRIDIVVKYKDKKIAIECDGEAYHSGEQKLLEDMERQTLLERLGWTFIRIRGSEYYRNKELTLKRVREALSGYGINPELLSSNEKIETQELKNRVIFSASQILRKISINRSYSDI
ncbi:AAA domain-containing protein [Caviibacter abscessus]|uniref:AAA domain-containing protein n=1 Tax=Caviibacter abscessus TaxID=1766719 RepID=UPI00082C6506|nr:AAA domain-containing protein [Caviibacter abscessus]